MALGRPSFDDFDGAVNVGDQPGSPSDDRLTRPRGSTSRGGSRRDRLLILGSEVTPRSMFPNRRIGRLDEGYEASFLVLAGDPITDFGQVREIKARFKQGRELPSAPAR